jgi:low affinity Fe/Cu permease
MVFLIQQSQNKDSLAIHVKLNELLAANALASNRVIAVEDLDEQDLIILRKFYCHLAELAANDKEVGQTHSLDEAVSAHARKSQAPQRNRGAPANTRSES